MQLFPSCCETEFVSLERRTEVVCDAERVKRMSARSAWVGKRCGEVGLRRGLRVIVRKARVWVASFTFSYSCLSI